jgi:hypothetical protein
MTSFVSDVKKTALKNVGRSMMQHGIIGKALGKAFTKKFAEDEEDTRVRDALDHQSEQIDTVNTTLYRMESIVMNIADNIYNIAGVWSNYVSSMEEAKRAQKEQMFKDAAAKEESDAEALASAKVSGPGAAASKEEEGKKGLFDGLIKSVTSTKSIVKDVLKTVGTGLASLAAIGGVAAGLGAVAAVFAPSANAGEVPRLPSGQTDLSLPSQSAMPVPAAKEQTSDNVPPINVPASATQEVEQVKTQAATQVAPPPPIAVTTPPAQDSEVEKISSYLERPENAADKQQLTEVQNKITRVTQGIELTKNLINNEKDPAKKQEYQDILRNQLEPQLETAKQEKKDIVQRATKATAVASKVSAPPAPTSAPTGQAAAEAPSSGTSSSSVASSGGSEASMVTPPAPSTGTEISTASTSLAAAGESSPSNVSETNVSNSGATNTSGGGGIPSPIADRGSLDVGTTFNVDG